MTEKLEPIRHSLTVDVPMAHLWRVMTEPETVAQWLGCLNYSARVGHTFHMQPDPAKRAANDLNGATFCDVEALDAPDHFAFSWYMPGTPKTHVSLRLTALDATRTQLDLIHDGWDQFPADMVRAIRDGLANGWGSMVLPGLVRLAKAT